MFESCTLGLSRVNHPFKAESISILSFSLRSLLSPICNLTHFLKFSSSFSMKSYIFFFLDTVDQYKDKYSVSSFILPFTFFATTSFEQLSSTVDTVNFSFLLETAFGCEDTIFPQVSFPFGDQLFVSFTGSFSIHFLNSNIAIVSVFGSLLLILDSLLKQTFTHERSADLYF